MKPFFRFPHTPHIAWLGSGLPREDKVLSKLEAKQFFSHDLVLEEKIDGANLGLSVDEDGTLRAQNRGSYIDLQNGSGQFSMLASWIAPRQDGITQALYPDLMLFGEWCRAVHSIRYTALPDWFLVFDVYDRQTQSFWSSSQRNDLANSLGLAVVPEVGRGRFDIEAIVRLLGQSRCSDVPAEGIYLRHEDNGQTPARAKLVRPDFVQSIGEHWSKKRIEYNQLAVVHISH